MDASTKTVRYGDGPWYTVTRVTVKALREGDLVTKNRLIRDPLRIVSIERGAQWNKILFEDGYVHFCGGASRWDVLQEIAA